MKRIKATLLVALVCTFYPGCAAHLPVEINERDKSCMRRAMRCTPERGNGSVCMEVSAPCDHPMWDEQD